MTFYKYPLFKTLNILPIAKLHVFAVQIHTYTTRSVKHFHLPSIRSNIMFQTFRYKGIKSHNNFLTKLISTYQCKDTKKALREHLNQSSHHKIYVIT